MTAQISGVSFANDERTTEEDMGADADTEGDDPGECQDGSPRVTVPTDMDVGEVRAPVGGESPEELAALWRSLQGSIASLLVKFERPTPDVVRGLGEASKIAAAIVDAWPVEDEPVSLADLIERLQKVADVAGVLDGAGPAAARLAGQDATVLKTAPPAEYEKTAEIVEAAEKALEEVRAAANNYKDVLADQFRADWEAIARAAMDRSHGARVACADVFARAVAAVTVDADPASDISEDGSGGDSALEPAEAESETDVTGGSQVAAEEEALEESKAESAVFTEEEVVEGPGDEDGSGDAESLSGDGATSSANVLAAEVNQLEDLDGTADDAVFLEVAAEVVEGEGSPKRDVGAELDAGSVGSEDSAGPINDRLKQFFLESEFGAAHHLCRAAGTLMPEHELVLDSSELRLLATTGFVPGMSYAEVERNNAAIGDAIAVANRLVAEESAETELGQARRMALFAAAIEMALFAGGTTYRGAMDLIEVLVRNGVGNCFYGLWRAADYNRRKGFPLTVSNLCGAASRRLAEHADKLRIQTFDRLKSFQARYINFSSGESVRAWIVSHPPIGDAIRAFRAGKGEKEARRLAEALVDWKAADAFISRAEKESGAKTAVFGTGRDKFLRDITEIADLCNAWTEALDAMSADTAREAVVREVAGRVLAACEKSLADLQPFCDQGGLVGAAANLALDVVGRLRGMATGEQPPLGDPERPGRVLNGPLLWLPGLVFGDNLEPVPWEPERIVDGFMGAWLPAREARREPGVFEGAIRTRLQEGAFIAAGRLVALGPHYGIDADICAVLTRDIEAEKPARREAIRADLDEVRSRVIRAQRFATEYADELIDLADQLDEIVIERLGQAEYESPEANAESLVDFVSVERRLANVRDQVAAVLAGPREVIGGRISKAVQKGQLSENLREAAERLLEEGDFATAEEIVEHALGGHAVISGIVGPDAFNAFFPNVPRILSRDTPERDAVRKAIEDGKDMPTLSFSQVEEKEEALELVQRWWEFKRVAAGQGGNGSAVLTAASSLLEKMGLSNEGALLDPALSSAARKVWVGDMRMRVARDDIEKSVLLPDFGSMARGGWRLCVFPRRPNPDELRKVCDVPPHMAVLILVTQVIEDSKREEDARRMIEDGRRALIVDEALFLFALSRPRFRVLDMFEVAQAFSYATPFGDCGDEPVPEEMFVGRREEIETVRSHDRGFFVYGGRRLGKTALLQFVTEAENRSAEGRVSAYVSLQQMTKATNVWVQSSGRLETVFGGRKVVNGDEFSRQVRDWLEKDPKRTILLFLDEANEYVREDQGREYQEFRQFQSLMFDTGRRFKVVFAGLQNIARLARYSENQPVSHFDSAVLAIGPFIREDVRYAETLLTRPLAGMGYTFAHEDDIWRVLSFCNYYPILIQLFGENLIRLLREKTRAEGRIERVIGSDLVNEVLNDVQTMKAIHDAVDKTLKLDGSKYELLAHVLAENMMGSQDRGVADEGLTAREVRAAAAAYWPAAFAGESVTVDMVDALLEEMEVLGLLRNSGPTRWTLRSRSILFFLGGSEKVIETLLTFEDRPAPDTFDPRQRRRDIGKPVKKPKDRDFRPARRSPLTTGQEFDILKREGESVRVVFGVEAAGLAKVLEALLEAPMTQVGSGVEVVRCTARTDTEMLKQIGGPGRLGDGRRTVFVIPHTLGWNQEWVRKARSARSVRDGRLQAIFVGGPVQAYEQVHKETRDGDPGVLHLPPWQISTTSRMLGDAHIVEAEATAKRVHDLAGGWNELMNDALPEGASDEEGVEKALKFFKSLIKEDADLDRKLGLRAVPGLPEPCLRALRETAVWAGEDGVFSQADIADAIDLTFKDDIRRPSARVVLDYVLLLGLADTVGVREERRGMPRERVARRFNELVRKVLLDQHANEGQVDSLEHA